jgi:hypothetical protein
LSSGAILLLVLTYLPVMAVAGHWDLGRDLRGLGRAINKAAIDVGNAVGTAVTDTRVAIGQAGTDARIFVGELGTDVDQLITRNKKEIAIGVAVGAMIYTACVPDGCDILVGTLGGKYVWVGTIGGGAASAVAAGATTPTAKSTGRTPTASRETPAGSTKTSTTAVAASPATDSSDSIQWEYGGLLANRISRYESETKEFTKDIATDYAQDKINEAVAHALKVTALGGPAMEVVSMVLKPSTMGPNDEWNVNMEMNERLNVALDAVINQKTGVNNLQTGSVLQYLFAPKGTPTVTASPPGAEFKAGPVASAPLTAREEIDLKAETLGGLLGISPEEVMRRIDRGLDHDLHSQWLRAQKSQQK